MLKSLTYCKRAIGCILPSRRPHVGCAKREKVAETELRSPTADVAVVPKLLLEKERWDEGDCQSVKMPLKNDDCDATVTTMLNVVENLRL